MTTTVETVTAKTQTVADLIEGPYNVYVCDDGASPYISINNTEDDKTFRCLSLSDDGQCGDDLSKYHWSFWTGNYTVSEVSLLGADEPTERVLNFLKTMIQVEAEH